MDVLYLNLLTIDDQQVELRTWRDDPKQYEDKVLKLTEIDSLIQDSELNFYIPEPTLRKLGQQLYRWLDTEARWLTRAITSCASEGLILAISVEAKLAHLPWEILHDGTTFLCQKSHPLVVPVRWLDQPLQQKPPQERPLQVLFMATSPEGTQPVLNFEQEENTILKITEKLPLTLRVEESGCIKELETLWLRDGDTFDVFHLTGHADHQRTEPFEPYFITESLTGERQQTSAAQLQKVFQVHKPRLIFLSGCRTGEAGKEGAVPSLAESLIQQGIPAVLGWGRPIADGAATKAAALLYQYLAARQDLAQALAQTLQTLIQDQVNGWHLLRLYVRGQAWGALVNPPRVYQPPPPAIQYQFLDREQKVRVATPDQFVGRRRLLQRGLRALKQSRNLGLFIHGIGGVGKSTIAARLLERMPDYQPIVVFQRFDQQALERLLQQQCTSSTGLKILNGDLPLMQRLTLFLDQGLNHPNQQFIFILDDFEFNLDQHRQLNAKGVVETLNALMQALERSQTPHRLLITCRYDLQLPQLNERLERLPVAALKGADLLKKCEQLLSFRTNTTVETEKREQAQALSDGNPRLLEWLDTVLQDPLLETDTILAALEKKTAEFRESILAESILAQQSETLKQVLTRMQVFELPVPDPVVVAVCQSISGVEDHCQRAVAVGLLEVTQTSSEMLYRLPRLLVPLLPQPPTVDWYQAGVQALQPLWWTKSGCSEEKALELWRLANLAQDNEIADLIGSSIGNHWKEQGRYREAIGLWEQIVTIRQAQTESEDQAVAFSLNELALLYDNQGRYEETEPLYQQALNMTKRLLGDEHPDVATSLNNLALLYDNQGRYEEAEPLYQQALHMKKRLLGDEHPDVAQSLNNLALLYDNQGRYEEAEPLFQQALNMRKRLLGEEHPSVASSLNNLAALYDNQGRYEEAEPLFQQALNMRKRLLGEEHPDVATSLNNLAALYDNQGRYEEAEPLFQQALHMRKRLLGDEHPSVASSLNNLALLYDNQGRYEEAEPLFQQALNMKKRLLGDEHPSVANSLNNLAALYKNQGRYEEAETYYQQALHMRKRLLGDEHPDVASSLNNLALLYKNQGRYEEAETYYLQAISVAAQSLGPEHPNTITILRNFYQMVTTLVRNGQQDSLSKEQITQSIIRHIQQQAQDTP